MYEKYEKHFYEIYKKSSKKFKTFPHHVSIVRDWAEKLCDQHPEANRKVVVIASLFHDLGHFVENNDEDHAVYSEKEAVRFLENEGADKILIKKVAQAVRTHRNADKPPLSIEDKIIVFADSASHLTTPDVYLYIAAGYGKEKALEKLERDYRDLALFPSEKEKLKFLYKAWKNILNSFPEDFYRHIRAREK